MYAVLNPCNGPPCPRCGCRDVEILAAPAKASTNQAFFVGGSPDAVNRWPSKAWWGDGRAQCRHCGLEFGFEDLSKREKKAAPSEPSETTCPRCGANKYYKYKGVYRKCRACGHSKSKAETH